MKVNGDREVTYTIFRTSWRGAKPVRLAEGYALDIWKDPATKIDWVYCARKLTGNGPSEFLGHQLWCFQLEKPEVEELLVDQILISNSMILVPLMVQLDLHLISPQIQFHLVTQL